MPPSKLRTLYSPRVRFIPDNQDSPPRTFASLEEILIPFPSFFLSQKKKKKLPEEMYTRATRWKWRTIQFRAKWSTPVISSNDGKHGQMNLVIVHLNSLLDNRELLEIMLHIIRLYEGVQVSKTSLSVPLTIVARICVLYARWSLWNIVDTNGSKSKWFNHDRFYSYPSVVEGIGSSI